MDNNANGITAMLAHNARTANDNIFTRSIVEGYLFLGFGTVTAYTDERVTVACGSRVFTNIEVMVLGVDGWGIKPVPAINDRVLLLSTQSPIPDLQKFDAPGSMPAYDASGLKAIPITDSNTAQLITVDKDGIVVTGDNKITVNADGIQVEDANGNKVTTSSDGVAFEDTNGNKVTASSDGITLEDKSSNKFTSDSSGTVLEDTNGCKITTGSSGVDINGKLTIGK